MSEKKNHRKNDDSVTSEKPKHFLDCYGNVKVDKLKFSAILQSITIRSANCKNSPGIYYLKFDCCDTSGHKSSTEWKRSDYDTKNKDREVIICKKNDSFFSTMTLTSYVKKNDKQEVIGFVGHKMCITETNGTKHLFKSCDKVDPCYYREKSTCSFNKYDDSSCHIFNHKYKDCIGISRIIIADSYRDDCIAIEASEHYSDVRYYGKKIRVENCAYVAGKNCHEEDNTAIVCMVLFLLLIFFILFFMYTRSEKRQRNYLR